MCCVCRVCSRCMGHGCMASAYDTVRLRLRLRQNVLTIYLMGYGRDRTQARHTERDVPRDSERGGRMKKRRCGLPLLAAQLLHGTSPAQGFTGSPAFNRGNRGMTALRLRASRDEDGWSMSRRRAVASAASLLTLNTLSNQPAFALKERNEVLCSTGFFTNVGAWYCTDIGNIGDGKYLRLCLSASSSALTLIIENLQRARART